MPRDKRRASIDRVHDRLNFVFLRIRYSLVPPQTPESVIPLVITYIESEFAKLNSKNKLNVEYLHGGKPWVADVNHWNFEAARKAIEVRRCDHSPFHSHSWERLGTDRRFVVGGELGGLEQVARLYARGRVDPCNAHVCREIGGERVVAPDGPGG